MKRAMLCIFASLLCFTAQATYVPGLDVQTGYDIVITSGSCPAGFAEDTAMRGFVVMGNSSGGTIGNSVGTAQTGASPTLPTMTAGTFSATGTNLVSTAGAVPSITNFNSTAIVAGANTLSVPAQTVTSSSIAIKFVMFCKKT